MEINEKRSFNTKLRFQKVFQKTRKNLKLLKIKIKYKNVVKINKIKNNFYQLHFIFD